MANPKLAQSAGDRRQQCSFSNVRGQPFGGSPSPVSLSTAEVVHHEVNPGTGQGHEARRSHVLKISADVGTGYSMMPDHDWLRRDAPELRPAARPYLDEARGRRRQGLLRAHEPARRQAKGSYDPRRTTAGATAPRRAMPRMSIPRLAMLASDVLCEKFRRRGRL
jgi:hypothetical protein